MACPAAPLPGLIRTGVRLLAFCLVAVLVLVGLGYVHHDNSHRQFGQRKAGTYLSCINLLVTAAVATSTAGRVRATPFAHFSQTRGRRLRVAQVRRPLTLHEHIDRGLHGLLGPDPDPPSPTISTISSSPATAWRRSAWPTVIVGSLSISPGCNRILGGAFMLLAARVVIDFLHWSNPIEDSLKVVAGTLIFVGFLAARLELGERDRPRTAFPLAARTMDPETVDSTVRIGVLLAVLTLAGGCATTSSQVPGEAPVTDFKQVAGAWRTTGGSASQGSLVIQTNGRYWMRIGYIAALQGQFRLEGGALHYELGPSDQRRGKATLVDDRGTELLRFTDDSGLIWLEWVRSL